MSGKIEESFRDSFPARLFMIYILFYAGQAMYNTYLNLFLNSKGFSMTAIGALGSISTILLVLIQPLWGVLSDKSKSKNNIVGFLLIVVAIVGVGFYASDTAIWLAVCVMLYSIFFTPAMSLQDNYALESLEKSKWDFGNVRLGGTIGYAACAGLVGFIIKDNYGQIFWMMSLFFLVTGILYFSMPRVSGHRQKNQKVKYTVLFKDRPLVCMFFFNVLYSLGTQFYFQFYPLHYHNVLGASSQMVGLLSTFSAISEIPFFWYAFRIEKRFGPRNVMLFAGIATTLRWFLLYFVTDQYLVLAVNLLSGCGYVGFMYCLIKYINDNVPRSMRATAQSLNGILGTIFSRILFAPIGGILADFFGAANILLVAGVLMGIGCVGFGILFPMAERYQKAHPLSVSDRGGGDSD